MRIQVSLSVSILSGSSLRRVLPLISQAGVKESGEATAKRERTALYLRQPVLCSETVSVRDCTGKTALGVVSSIGVRPLPLYFLG